MNGKRGSLNSQQGRSNIAVVLRIRPLNDKEKSFDNSEYVKFLEETKILASEPTKKPHTQRDKAKQVIYTFGHIFPPASTQIEVFAKTVSPLVGDVLNGYNATAFAYGATGAGKTFTILGSASYPGIMPQSVSELFSHIKSQNERQYLLKLSYVEIYNEIVKDLLCKGKNNLEIRENTQRGTIVIGLTEIIPKSDEDVREIIRSGNSLRTTERTNMNEASSRSHAILQISVESRENSENMQQILFGKLSLVDLAGSERASRTNSQGMRLKEGGSINKSLLSLANCMKALVERKTGKKHVPYRDSKLTRLLKDSLDGNCKTLMIACVSPYGDSFEDTHSTIKYAYRAQAIELNVKKNIINTEQKLFQCSMLMGQMTDEAQIEDPELRVHITELNEHFKREIKLKMEMYAIQNSIDQSSFDLFSKQCEFEEVATLDPSNDALKLQLMNEIAGIKNFVEKSDQTLEFLYSSIAFLEAKREGFTEGWVRVPESLLMQLKLRLNNKLLKMVSIESESKDYRTQEIMKQKDLLIELLSDQLKMRDQIIDSTSKYLQQKNFCIPTEISEPIQELKSFNSLTHRIRSVPKVTDRPPLLRKASRLPLASIGSRIVRKEDKKDTTDHLFDGSLTSRPKETGRFSGRDFKFI